MIIVKLSQLLLWLCTLCYIYQLIHVFAFVCYLVFWSVGVCLCLLVNDESPLDKHSCAETLYAHRGGGLRDYRLHFLKTETCSCPFVSLITLHPSLASASSRLFPFPRVPPGGSKV